MVSVFRDRYMCAKEYNVHVKKLVAISIGDVVAHTLRVVGHEIQAPRVEDLVQFLNVPAALRAGERRLQDGALGLALVERLARGRPPCCGCGKAPRGSCAAGKGDGGPDGGTGACGEETHLV